jgi:two-component system phosphate regulon response regulator PhoB
VIILDLMLPNMSGLEVCRVLKSDKVTKHIPIVMLTAKSAEADRIAGLELGADDYITKPFSPREVMLRVKAIERRHATDVVDERLVNGLITIDAAQHHVEVAGRRLTLTTAEFNLLATLMRRPGRLLSRDMLLTGAWGYESAINTRTVDTHVRRLRRKLGKAAKQIETVRGFGYRLRED